MASWGLGMKLCTTAFAASEWARPRFLNASASLNLESWMTLLSEKPFRAMWPLVAASSGDIYSCALALAVMWLSFDSTSWMADQYGT